MKRTALICAVVFGITGSLVLLRCLSLASALGGWDYGDFMQFAWVGYDATTRSVTFTDYPTGERPWYSFVPAWWIGFGSLGLSTASAVTYRKLRKRS